ncbi:MAG: 3-phosphoshikimate 1-carboxyvinyltransferase [Deltaproteobacteria bacterium]|nr:3-phosphoshikimate 1-carboxyvinyltransferase [Deltaproteobacteria bacterium]
MTPSKNRPALRATVRIPGSKSITHRALIAASLAEGRSVLKDFLKCEDTLHTINALRQIGVDISINGAAAEIKGRGGRFSHNAIRKEIFLGNSGTSFRLLLSVVALCKGEFLITGTRRMQERPIGPLIEALNRLGVKASCIQKKGYPPVHIEANGIRGGRVSIQGNQSSQFLSSLLLTGPYGDSEIDIAIVGELVSRPYVDMTLHVMNQFGIRVDHDQDNRFKIFSGQTYRAREFVVQGDASSASYFWAAAAVTGGTIVTHNIHPYATRQGDIRFLEILERMGCVIEKGSDRVTVHGGNLSGVEVDMVDLPDMVPTLAAVALFAQGKTIIQNVAHLRHKESDRLRALTLEWRRMGGRIEEFPDGLVIHGGIPLSGTVVAPHNDHRLAMSLAVVALRVPHLEIKDKDCVQKSFPTFWNVWNGLQHATDGK